MTIKVCALVCCRIRWYQVRWRATCTYSPAHLSIRWKCSTRITVKATPETNPVIRHQTPWSPTCTAKQDKMPPTDTHMVDPSIAAAKRTQPTKHLYKKQTQQWFSLLNPDLDQIWHRWHSSSKQQRKKISLSMWFIPFGCVSCTFNFHSVGTRCFLCLAGESGHHRKTDWKQVRERCNTYTTVSQHANRRDSLFRLKSWMILWKTE